MGISGKHLQRNTAIACLRLLPRSYISRFVSQPECAFHEPFLATCLYSTVSIIENGPLFSSSAIVS